MTLKPISRDETIFGSGNRGQPPGTGPAGGGLAAHEACIADISPCGPSRLTAYQRGKHRRATSTGGGRAHRRIRFGS